MTKKSSRSAAPASAPKSYDAATVKQLEKSQVEITASIPADVWAAFRAKALKSINAAISIDGFRKGMVPENILVSKVGDMAILEEMAELAVSRAYVDILIDQKIDAIGRPEIRVTKIAAGNPLEFVAVTAVVPKVKLPDYKKIAADEIAKSSPDEEKVTAKDIDEAILRVRKAHASHEGHDHEKMTPEEHDKALEASMPELTDDFVKSIGDFADVADFKARVESMLADEKKDTAREKRRIRIADALSAATDVSIPDLMVKSELERIEAQFTSDIERMGVTLEDYLKHAKKTAEEIREDWRPSAEKKAKLQLILNSIALAENIRPDQKEIDEEVAHITQHYKEADTDRAAVYAETVLTNEKVFQFLESQKA